MTQKVPQNLWQMDIRIRERNLKSGSLTEKDVEKYLAGLPDLEGQSESFGTSQPALAARPEAAAVSDADLADEGDEDEDEPETGGDVTTG